MTPIVRRQSPEARATDSEHRVFLPYVVIDTRPEYRRILPVLARYTYELWDTCKVKGATAEAAVAEKRWNEIQTQESNADERLTWYFELTVEEANIAAVALVANLMGSYTHYPDEIVRRVNLAKRLARTAQSAQLESDILQQVAVPV